MLPMSFVSMTYVFFVIVTCSLHILPLQVMFSGKIIEYKYNGTFVWMNKLPVSCDEQDATRKNIKPRSHTAINFFLLVRVRYT